MIAVSSKESLKNSFKFFGFAKKTGSSQFAVPPLGGVTPPEGGTVEFNKKIVRSAKLALRVVREQIRESQGLAKQALHSELTKIMLKALQTDFQAKRM